MRTMPPSTTRLSKVGSMATVRMMSPATSISRPSRMDRPMFCRNVAYDPPRSPAISLRRAIAPATAVPDTMTATPRTSMSSPSRSMASRGSINRC